MAQRAIYSGSSSVLVNILLINATTGNGLTGLVFNTSGLTAYYYANNAVGSVAIPLLTMTLGTWVSGGFKEVDSTNMPGLYSLGLPNAALAGQAITIVLQGAANLKEFSVDLAITATNDQDAERGGLLALPNGNMQLKKNQALSNFQFLMVSNVDHVTPVAGLTVTTQVSINGAAFTASANAATGLSNGIYNLNLAAADLNGNTITLMCSATGADTRYVTFITQP